MKSDGIRGRRGSWLVSGLVWLCLGAGVGCMRHGVQARGGGYRLQMLPEMTVLVPPGVAEVKGGLQTTVVALGRAEAATPVGCVVEGKLFSLRQEKDGRWLVTSPDVGRWNTAAVQADMDGEWNAFVRGLSAVAAKGCFPAGMSRYAVQRRIVEAIAIPADKALRFYYSLTNTGFVDLQPGMQIGIETVTASAQGTSETVRLAVVDRAPAGVALEVVPAGKGERAGASTLPADFARMPLLRVFLERAATGTEGAREAMLLGAATAEGLDAATEVVLRDGERGCAGELVAARCVVFAGRGVSLLTAVSLNGRTAFYAPGTALAQVIDALPERQHGRAMATFTVERQTAAGMVPVEVPRSDEGMMGLLLISGDRIRWRK